MAIDVTVSGLNTVVDVEFAETPSDIPPETYIALRGEKGDKGDTGAAGRDGTDGVDGADGISPIATVSKVGSTATISITDANGTTTATVTDGADGQDGQDGADGQDGVSPSATVSKVGDTATITITDANGTTTANISDGTDGVDGADGADGTDGTDGFSPIATVTKSGDTATISITDKNGTTTATVQDGTQANAFTAEFGTTTYADVKDAYDDDAILICTVPDGDNTMVLQLVYFDATNEIFFFAEPNGDGWYWTQLSNADGWDDGTRYLASTDVATQLADGLMSALDKQKLDGIASGAEVNVQSDWSQSTNTADDYIKNKPTIPSKTSDLVNDSLYARGHIASFHGTCSTGAATAEKAVTCADFKATDLVAGAIIVVSFSETNSAAVADLTLNVNGTGAYHIKRNSAGTIGNLDAVGNLKASSSYMFYFDGSYWVIAAYYNDTNTNTIGYTIRTNGLQLPVKTQMYRYRICFTSADGEYFVPANASTSTSATASKTVTTEKIDPFGRIVYYNATAAVAVNSYPTASTLCQQYNGIYLGYSFNRTGAALTLTNHKPVYIKCAPQTDGSAIIDSSTPFVQALPSTADGKIYIFLGVATAATTIEMVLEHPVYEYKGGHIREYTPTSEVSVTQITSTGTKIATVTVDGTATDLYAPSGGGGGGITDVTVDGTSVVTGTTAAIDLTGKSDVGHTHTKSAITDFPSIPTITDTYSGTSQDGMSGIAVKSAIDALDGTVSGTAGSGKTLTAFSQTDGKVSATFGNISITKSQVSDFPTIPTVNDATLTIQKNGTNVATFTANASSNVTANISVPTDTGDLTNGAGFITGYTETDPVFTASDAYGITSTDITNWNGKLDKAGILSLFYPVGSYYETSDTTFDPNISWGGTWSLETAGQVHISAGTSTTSTVFTVNGANANSGVGMSDGGEEEHWLTVNEMPTHNHGYYYTGSGTGTKSLAWWSQSGNGLCYDIVDTGGNQTHNNMQPYIVVNRWHRTA